MRSIHNCVRLSQPVVELPPVAYDMLMMRKLQILELKLFEVQEVVRKSRDTGLLKNQQKFMTDIKTRRITV
jgi:hypothetical protein